MIRSFELTDFSGILDIEAQAYPKSSYRPEVFLYYHRVLRDTFLVYAQDTVLGYIIFEPDGHIISLAVDPVHRRMGIGRRLMKACESRCGGSTLRVEVRAGNTGAQKFYESLGFQVNSRVRFYYGTEDGLIMQKTPC